MKSVVRESWGKYGAWSLVFLCVLLCQPHGCRVLGGGLGSILLCLSLTMTMATLFHRLCDTFGFTRLYSPYFMKWLSWFIANSLLSFVSFGLIGVCATVCMFGVSDSVAVGLLLFVLALPFPVWRLLTHIREDLETLRRAPSKLAII